jgi:prepilin-type processing-associated H-X9-DG protein
MTTNTRKQINDDRAFTLTELCVVVALLIILATVTLPALENANEPARRIQCAANFRQIGAALNIYCAESKDYLPICGWRGDGSNPWETGEACRFDAPGSTNIIYGFENLALLFRTKVITDARLFYCPAIAATSTSFSYNTYATAPSGWPSIPIGFSGNPYVRMGYNYYPQLRTTEFITGPLANYTLPKLTFLRANLEFGSFNLMTPAKLTDVNPKKSITTDLLETWGLLSHQEYGSPAGVNALFPDGHVAFQNARTNSSKGSSQPFDPNFWANGNVVGNDPISFRVIMNGFQP